MTMTMATPVLRRSAKVSRQDGRMVIKHLDEEISLEGKGAALLERMVPLLDGKNNVEQIAARIEEAQPRVKALADQLHNVGVISYLEADGTMTGAEFYKVHGRYSRYWLTDVYAHP